MAKGYCHKHYSNFYNCGNPLGKFNGNKEARRQDFIARKIWINNRKFYDCQVEGCKNKHYAKHYCHKHYVNFRRCGNPLAKIHKCLAENCNRKTNNPKYCCIHSLRNSKHRSLDLSVKYHCRGSRNYMWRGGVAEYPNHSLMKRQRLIILMHNPKCEYCGKPATEIHHKDENKANHKLSNLAPACRKCNAKQSSKFYKRFGYTLSEIVKILGRSQSYWCLHSEEINHYLLDKKGKVCL